jgi:aryl-alcohol dehydrogenase-like predicted oxidoreductase
VERSLKRLNRDYVDVVLVHSDGNDMRIVEHEGVMAELEALKSRGLIRAYGMSTKTVEGGLWVVEHCDVVMATRNLSDDHDLPVIDAALQNNKGVLVKKGLQSGHAAQSAGGPGVEESFKHVFSHPGVSSMIVGTIDPRHLQQNAEVTGQVFAQLKAERR